MKFVLDQNVKRGARAWFARRGLDCVHVADWLDEKAPDGAIVAAAARDERIIVTRDKDFEALPDPRPQIVLIKIGNCSNAVLIAAWDAAWPRVEMSLLRGDALVVIERGGPAT